MKPGSATMLIGEPGAGKSTILLALLSVAGFRFYDKPFAHHRDDRRRLTVLGKYESGCMFPGTDRLSMSVQPYALAFVADQVRNGKRVIWEGARLGNGKMVQSLVDRGIEPRIGFVTAPKELEARHARERNQTDRFRQARRTAVMNVASQWHPLVTRLTNDTDRDLATNLAWLLGVNLTDTEGA